MTSLRAFKLIGFWQVEQMNSASLVSVLGFTAYICPGVGPDNVAAMAASRVSILAGGSFSHFLQFIRRVIECVNHIQPL